MPVFFKKCVSPHNDFIYLKYWGMKGLKAILIIMHSGQILGALGSFPSSENSKCNLSGSWKSLFS